MPNCPHCQASLPADRGRVVCSACDTPFHFQDGTMIGQQTDELRPERRAILVNWLLWDRWYALVRSV